MAEPTYNTSTPDGIASERVIVQEKLRHVSWGAIFLGLIVAIALQILLGLLGIGLGFTIVDPSDPMGGIGTWGIATSIYVVIVQIISLFVGGYIAARLAPACTDQTAMFHGLSIWAIATIVMVWLGTTTAGLAASGISGAVSGIASATGRAIEIAVPEDISLPDISYENLPQPLRETLRENGITPENLQQEIRNAYRDVVSRQEEQRLLQKLQQTIQAILQNPTDAAEEIDQAIDEAFGEGGIISEEDFSQMENTLQRRLNLSDQEVEQIRNEIQQTFNQTRENVREAAQTAKEEAVKAADAVTGKIGSIALWMFLANLLGLIAAVFGGKAGEVKPRAT